LVLFLESAILTNINAQTKSRHRQKKQSTMTDDQRLAHVLSRLTFGARPGDFERVKAMGVEAFINQQLDPDSIDVTALSAKLRRPRTLNMATRVIIEHYNPPKPAVVPSPPPAKTSSPSANQAPNLAAQKAETGSAPGAAATSLTNEMQMGAKKEAGAPESQKSEAVKTLEAMVRPDSPQANAAPKPTPPPKNPQMIVTELQRAKLLRAVYSDRQLYEVMVDFWENHFSIFANKDDDRYLLTGFDRETIRPFALGRFRDLLGATAHSPAMLFYLDNWRSSVPRPYPATATRPAGVDGGLN